MAGSSDMNVVLGQSTAVKEVHNTQKQNMELNQQFISQTGENEKKEAKSKVQNSEKGDRVTLKKDEEKEEKNQKRQKKEKPKNKPSEEERQPSEGSLIDITV
jgi:hypothetical protein